MNRTDPDHSFLILMAIVTLMVWTYLLCHTIRIETRSEFMLDNTGAPVEVVWELGKGERPATAEEREGAKR